MSLQGTCGLTLLKKLILHTKILLAANVACNQTYNARCTIFAKPEESEAERREPVHLPERFDSFFAAKISEHSEK